jgi:hypothetical protein
MCVLNEKNVSLRGDKIFFDSEILICEESRFARISVIVAADGSGGAVSEVTSGGRLVMPSRGEFLKYIEEGVLLWRKAAAYYYAQR